MSRAVPRTTYWCHSCNQTITPSQIEDELKCSVCSEGFVEEITDDTDMLELAPAGLNLPGPFRREHVYPFGGNQSEANGEGAGGTAGAGDMENPSSGSQRNFMAGDQSMPGFRRYQRDRAANGGGANQAGNTAALLDAIHGIMTQIQNAQAQMAQHRDGVAGAQGGAANSMVMVQTQMQHLLNGRLEVFVDNGNGQGPRLLAGNMGDYFFGPGLEQLIQQLAEQDASRRGAPAAAKSAVEAMPTITITQEHCGSDGSQCAVCKDEFEVGNTVRQMPCRHMYHPDCILPWLEQHNSCPVCRYQMPTDDADYEAARTGGAGQGSRPNAAGAGAGAVNPNSNPNPNAPQPGQNVGSLVRRYRARYGFGELGAGPGAGGEGAGGGRGEFRGHVENSDDGWLRPTNDTAGAGEGGRGRGLAGTSEHGSSMWAFVGWGSGSPGGGGESSDASVTGGGDIGAGPPGGGASAGSGAGGAGAPSGGNSGAPAGSGSRGWGGSWWPSLLRRPPSGSRHAAEQQAASSSPAPEHQGPRGHAQMAEQQRPWAGEHALADELRRREECLHRVTERVRQRAAEDERRANQRSRMHRSEEGRMELVSLAGVPADRWRGDLPPGAPSEGWSAEARRGYSLTNPAPDTPSFNPNPNFSPSFSPHLNTTQGAIPGSGQSTVPSPRYPHSEPPHPQPSPPASQVGATEWRLLGVSRSQQQLPAANEEPPPQRGWHQPDSTRLEQTLLQQQHRARSREVQARSPPPHPQLSRQHQTRRPSPPLGEGAGRLGLDPFLPNGRAPSGNRRWDSPHSSPFARRDPHGGQAGSGAEHNEDRDWSNFRAPPHSGGEDMG